MNIFILDESPEKAAKYHCDKHCSKMILETAQILSTIHHQHGLEAPYKPTHKNHPCVVWAGATLGNYEWTRRLGVALGQEFERRRGKKHKSVAIIERLAAPPLLLGKMTPHALCLPESCIVDNDSVESYRQYYRTEKADIARWDWANNEPEWFKLKGETQ